MYRLTHVCSNQDHEMPEINFISVLTTRISPKEKVSLAVYFADFNVFSTWPKPSPCVAQFL